MDWMTGAWFLTEAEDLSSSLCIQTSSGAHPASCPMGTRASFPGGKMWPGRDADHSPPSSAEVKYEQELYLLSPHAPPWCVAGSLYLFTYKEIWPTVLSLYILCNKIGKVYSLEYTDIPKVFFMPHRVGHCCTDMIWLQCCTLGQCATMCYNNYPW
jgi:hypothetical protein